MKREATLPYMNLNQSENTYIIYQVRLGGAKFHDINMVHDRIGQDLLDALVFQKSFAIVVCEALEMRFEGNLIMDELKVLGPTNMSHSKLDWHVGDYKNWRLFVLIMECRGIFMGKHFYL